MAKLMVPLERDVQRAITDLLTAHRIPFWRMNSGDRFGMTNGKKWRIKGHEPGTPDLLAAPKNEFGWPHYLWIEVKRPGGKQTPEQKNFETFANEQQMWYVLADSVEVVEKFLAENCK